MGVLARLRANLTYANVMATMAVFLALGGGAYAISVPRNSVGSKQLKKGAVASRNIKKGAVASRNIKNGAVSGAKVRDFTLEAKDLKPGTLPRGLAARADDTDPLPGPPGKVIKETTITTTVATKLYVLAALRDPFLTCSASGPCAAQWGVYVDDKPVPETGLRLQANPNEGDGTVFYLLQGFTPADLTPGRHDVKLARGDSANIASVGELGAQLGAFTLD
jgi:hypothetical protein